MHDPCLYDAEQLVIHHDPALAADYSRSAVLADSHPQEPTIPDATNSPQTPEPSTTIQLPQTRHSTRVTRPPIRLNDYIYSIISSDS